MSDADETYVEFCHLNPSRTATDVGDLELWLAERAIAFKHREGPAGDTVFLVPRELYAKAVELWADYRGSADFILQRLTEEMPPPLPPPLRRRAR